MPSSVFEGLKRRAQQYPGRIVPFHIGDTHLAPPEACRLGALGFSCDAEPDLYKYSPARGEEEFIGAVLAKVREVNGMTWADESNIQITAGATHALSCAVRAVLSPGDHILLLAPFWPLMRGISVSGGVRPVEVPFSQASQGEDASAIAARLESFITPQTAAIYFSTPNNPDGKLARTVELEAIAQVARRHDLWVLADEVYENFVFDGAHRSIATLPGMAERTLTVFSFSKSYALAGLRVGYAVGPSDAIIAVRKMSNHTVYNVPRAMQEAAHRAMLHGAPWVDRARQVYREHRDLAYELVRAPCALPQGSTYLFLDLSEYCRGEDTCLGVLERLVDAGMLLTPGGAFGHLFHKWARLCYTSVPRAELEEALGRLNDVLARS